MKRWLLLGFALMACNYRCTEPQTDPGNAWTHTRGRAHEKSCRSFDEIEPNQNTSERTELVKATCSGSQTIRGEVWDDVDTYHLRASRCDGVLSARLDQGDGVRFCVFATCARGTTGLVHEEADSGAPAAAFGPEGLRGRCRTGPGDVAVRIDCSGDGTTVVAASDVDVYLVVDHLTTDKCAPYDVTYRF